MSKLTVTDLLLEARKELESKEVIHNEFAHSQYYIKKLANEFYIFRTDIDIISKLKFINSEGTYKVFVYFKNVLIFDYSGVMKVNNIDFLSINQFNMQYAKIKENLNEIFNQNPFNYLSLDNVLTVSKKLPHSKSIVFSTYFTKRKKDKKHKLFKFIAHYNQKESEFFVHNDVEIYEKKDFVELSETQEDLLNIIKKYSRVHEFRFHQSLSNNRECIEIRAKLFIGRAFYTPDNETVNFNYTVITHHEKTLDSIEHIKKLTFNKEMGVLDQFIDYFLEYSLINLGNSLFEILCKDHDIEPKHEINKNFIDLFKMIII